MHKFTRSDSKGGLTPTLLSEQIKETCCGALADRQDMYEKAMALEAKVRELEYLLEEDPYHG